MLVVVVDVKYCGDQVFLVRCQREFLYILVCVFFVVGSVSLQRTDVEVAVQLFVVSCKLTVTAKRVLKIKYPTTNIQ